MTVKEIEILKKLKNNEIIELEGITIKKDRGQYNVTNGRFTKTYRDEEFNIMCEKLDQIIKKDNSGAERLSYEIPGTKLIVLKTSAGYEVYQSGKLLQKNMSEKELDAFVLQYKKGMDEKKLDKVRKTVVNEYKMSRQKKTLYYFILVLSVFLLSMTYILGIRFDGVTINRTNKDLYDVISEIAEVKYPERKFDKFDSVYYTLNYWAHEQNYFMTPIDSNTDELQLSVTNNYLYNYYLENELEMDLTEDNTYSGFEFNAYFKNEEGRYFNKNIIIRYIGYIIGLDNASSIEQLTAAYASWDDKDVRSNRAYNWEVLSADGSSSFDKNTTYYTTYLQRNPLLKLFINDSSKFIHEYNMFESIGWLTWVSMILLILYVLLAVSVWIFKKDNIKISPFLVKVIVITGLLVMSPLLLQFFFEGLSKNANEFLDILENTKFTTSTTLMNMIFDYIVKFSNIVLTGILTIALPLKVVRYFVLNAVQKLDKDIKIERLIAPGTILSESINSADWRL
jgi:hypothetical protein